MNIHDIDLLIGRLNDEAYQGELEHHGSCTTRFELCSNGSQMIVKFMGGTLWDTMEDEREEDESQPSGLEPLETFLRRESEAFMQRMLAKPTPDVPDPNP